MDKTSIFIVEIFLENVTYTPSSLTDLLVFFHSLLSHNARKRHLFVIIEISFMRVKLQ